MNTKVKILAFGINEITRSLVQKMLPNTSLIEREYTFDNLMSDDTATEFPIIICGTPPADIPLIEVAQSLRMNNQISPIYYTTSERPGFEAKLFIKNGFTDAFLLPMDCGVLVTAIQDAIDKLGISKSYSYRKVKLVDVTPGTVLDFSTYIHLPQNNKTIKVSNEGQAFDEERLQKFKSKHQQTLMVRSDQMSKFYEYTATQLKSVGSSENLSETEKREKTQRMIRSLFSSLYSDNADASFDQGKAFVEDCNKLIGAYLNGKSDDDNWYLKLMNQGNLDTGTYSHASNVAAYAALFSIALGIGKPEDLAFAGLLHDIGLANVPYEIQEKEYEQMTPDEKMIYEKHPQFSIDIIKNRKMSVSDFIQKIILQHHERFDEKGFPNKVSATKLSKEAQLLAIADRFDELCSGSINRAALLPVHALDRLLNECTAGSTPYDPMLIGKIRHLFSDPESENTQTAS